LAHQLPLKFATGSSDGLCRYGQAEDRA